MKVTGADLALSSQHSLVERHTRKESLVEGVTQGGAWEPGALADEVILTRDETGEQGFAEGSSILDRRRVGKSLEELTSQGQARARAAYKALTSAALDDLESVLQLAAPADLAPVAGSTSLDPAITSPDRAKIEILIATIERLSGKKLKLFAPEDLKLNSSAATEEAQSVASQAAAAAEQPAQPPQPTWGLRYNYQETHYEAETTTFAATGVVRTADGAEIAVEVDLTMGRQFASETNMEVRLGAAAQDPLVVNFGGTAAELSQTRYRFDLDADGMEEQIHFTGPNSGFLAVDRNDNGVVDDGSELFGPTTGDGFTELAAHDADNSEWIDESDPIYSQLRVWSRDEAGNDQLLALGQRGVGAIYLGHVTTPFAVKDGTNQLQAEVRSSGLYLREDGTAGTVQQLDLVV